MYNFLSVDQELSACLYCLRTMRLKFHVSALTTGKQVTDLCFRSSCGCFGWLWFLLRTAVSTEPVCSLSPVCFVINLDSDRTLFFAQRLPILVHSCQFWHQCALVSHTRRIQTVLKDYVPSPHGEPQSLWPRWRNSENKMSVNS